MTAAEAARKYTVLAATASATEHLGRTIAAEVATTSIKAAYGDAQKLEALAPSTQEERVRLGFTPNDPLRRDGSLLRDSIVREFTEDGFAVGSFEPIAGYQEFGYVNARTGQPVPPRPAVANGAAESLPEIERVMVATARAILGDRRQLEAMAFAIVDSEATTR